MPCPLQSYRQTPLMTSARAGLPARLDLAAVRQIATQPVDILVVNVLHLFSTEEAYFAARGVSRPSPFRPACCLCPMLLFRLSHRRL
jgi:hypothetical protein